MSDSNADRPIAAIQINGAGANAFIYITPRAFTELPKQSIGAVIVVTFAITDSHDQDR